MTGFSHASTGVLIALVLPKPLVAVPLALLSHFVLDSLPHWGSDSLHGGHRLFRRIIIADAILGFGIVFLMMFLLPQHWEIIALCGAAATIPDLMWLPNFLRETKNRQTKPHNLLMRLHIALQFERRWGIATEAVWLLLVIWLTWRIVV
jgi:hypothetical protein